MLRESASPRTRWPALAGVVAMLSWALASAGTPAVPAFADIFGDHMLLQRDAPIVIQGDGPPGVSVQVSFAGRRVAAVADALGRWQAVFPEMPAGGPYRLTLGYEGETLQSVEDVMVGDLWLCSGQSNMEFPLSRASGGPHGPPEPLRSLRLVTVSRDSSPLPRVRFAEKPTWSVADAAAAENFSAVCWFFARHLAESHPVPMGLIHASWGGSRIEPWLSAGALRELGGSEAQLDLLREYAEDREAGTRRFGASWEAWWRRRVSATEEPWTEEAEEAEEAGDAGEPGWKPVPGLRNWKTWGDPALTGHDGMLWFRNSFELSPAQARQDGVIALGGIDEVDLTWVNGRLAGTQFGWGTERRYGIPADMLHAGRNVVTLNVLSTWDAGGMLGPAADVALELTDGTTVALGDGWRYRRVPDDAGSPPRAPWESIGGLTGLSNAMIAPLGSLRLAGALWYQGESNTGDAEGYERLLAALAADWRRRFGDSLAFLVIQLPNFGTPPRAPGESGWARIRDAQRRVARDDPLTGLVVTLDAGDDRDLHPPDKETVGRRAADVAAALVFGDDGIVDGIGPVAAVRRGHEIVVTFEGDRPVVVGDDTPVAFELCGEAPAACRYADARLDDGRVVLDAGGMQRPARVRYCWADAPRCNLYGTQALPVGSFEIAITP